MGFSHEREPRRRLEHVVFRKRGDHAPPVLQATPKGLKLQHLIPRPSLVHPLAVMCMGGATRAVGLVSGYVGKASCAEGLRSASQHDCCVRATARGARPRRTGRSPTNIPLYPFIPDGSTAHAAAVEDYLGRVNQRAVEAADQDVAGENPAVEAFASRI